LFIGPLSVLFHRTFVEIFWLPKRYVYRTFLLVNYLLFFLFQFWSSTFFFRTTFQSRFPWMLLSTVSISQSEISLSARTGSVWR
jgi:hypothetical protein